MHERFQDQGVEFIGLTDEGESSLEETQEFLEETEITWRNGYGAAGTLAAFDCVAYPTMWVIGPDGKVVWNSDSEGGVEDGIEQALAGKVGDVSQ